VRPAPRLRRLMVETSHARRRPVGGLVDADVGRIRQRLTSSDIGLTPDVVISSSVSSVTGSVFSVSTPLMLEPVPVTSFQPHGLTDVPPRVPRDCARVCVRKPDTTAASVRRNGGRGCSKVGQGHNQRNERDLGPSASTRVDISFAPLRGTPTPAADSAVRLDVHRHVADPMRHRSEQPILHRVRNVVAGAHAHVAVDDHLDVDEVAEPALAHPHLVECADARAVSASGRASWRNCRTPCPSHAQCAHRHARGSPRSRAGPQRPSLADSRLFRR